MASNYNLFAHPPSLLECLAIAIGCAELSIFGIRGHTNPRGWLKGFGLPTTVTTPTITAQSDNIDDNQDEQQAAAVDNNRLALIDALAARNVQNGVLILTFSCVLRNRRALGIVVSAGLITTLTDTLVAWRYGVANAVPGHLIGVVNCVGIRAGLLYSRY